jgi:hypothetical protein
MSLANIDIFVKKVIDQKNKQITDEVFLQIQNDHIFMQEYLRLVETDTLDVVNMRIGKQVKEAYKLENALDRNNEPTSTLIQSYQEFKE